MFEQKKSEFKLSVMILDEFDVIKLPTIKENKKKLEECYIVKY